MLLTYDQNDLDSLELCTWKEARGTGEDGMRAVMHVICNRAKAWYHGSIHNAVYAKNQFTSMSVVSDPEYHLLPTPGDPQFAFCVKMSPSVVDGADSDLTCGAMYYWNPKTATSGWFKRHIVDDPVHHPKTISIGGQDFYK